MVLNLYYRSSTLQNILHTFIYHLIYNKLAFGQTRFADAADPIEHISEENFLLQIFAKMDTFMI